MKEYIYLIDFFLKLFFLIVVIKLMYICIYVFDNESYIVFFNFKDIWLIILWCCWNLFGIFFLCKLKCLFFFDFCECVF